MSFFINIVNSCYQTTLQLEKKLRIHAGLANSNPTGNTDTGNGCLHLECPVVRRLIDSSLWSD